MNIQAQERKTFNTILYCSIDGLDPIDAQTDCHVILIGQIFDTLFEISPFSLRVEPHLVEKYNYNETHTEYTFTLRPNIRFHDHNQLTSSDVIFSIERLISLQGSTYPEFLNITGAEDYRAKKARHISGLIKKDDHTFQIQLNKPDPLFLYKLTSVHTSILPSRHKDQILAKTFFIAPIGTGAFQPKSLDMQKKICLKSHEEYFLGKPDIDSLCFWRYGEKDAKALFKQGKLDHIFPYRFSSDELSSLSIQIIPYRVYYTILFRFNFHKEHVGPFRKNKNRILLRDISDLETLWKTNKNKMLDPASGYIPFGMPGYVNIKQPSNSIDNAQLSEISKRKIVIGISKGVDDYAKIIEHLKIAYEKRHIQTEFIIDDVGHLLEKVRKFQLDAVLISNFYTYPDSYSILQIFHSAAATNVYGYSNPQVDAMLRQALSLQDTKDRALLYQKINQKLYDEAATINFFYGANQKALFKKGWVIPPLDYNGELFLKYRFIKSRL